MTVLNAKVQDGQTLSFTKIKSLLPKDPNNQKDPKDIVRSTMVLQFVLTSKFWKRQLLQIVIIDSSHIHQDVIHYEDVCSMKARNPLDLRFQARLCSFQFHHRLKLWRLSKWKFCVGTFLI